MLPLKEFKNPDLTKAMLKSMQAYAPDQPVNLMEVCGTHTMQIAKYGLRKQLPPNVHLISGPGCPICVTPLQYIDKALSLIRSQDLVTVTFGDVFRVNGTNGNFEKEKASGKIIEVIYSPEELHRIIEKYPKKEIVFLSIGFETTLPTIALTLKNLKAKKLKNFSILCGNKLFMPALKTLIELILETKNSHIDGFILPGHLSIMTGEEGYLWLSENYKIPGVITGFEPVDIALGIRSLLKMIHEKAPSIGNEYSRIVSKKGNQNAVEIMKEVFQPGDSEWRGLGFIPGSGAILNEKYTEFDAEKKFKIPPIQSVENKGCRCGEVLMGIIPPSKCPMMGKVCTPKNPLGACMVSSEGSCAAWYHYEK